LPLYVPAKKERYEVHIFILRKAHVRSTKALQRARTLDKFTDSEGEIRWGAFDCLGRFELKKKVRLIGVRISNLEKVVKEGKIRISFRTGD
jgi:hypothetical protein